MLIQRYLPYVGGAERQIAAISPELRRLGIDVHVITRRVSNSLPKFELLDSTPVHRLPCYGGKALDSVLYSGTAQCLLAKLKPDVVHAHELLSPLTTALIYKRLTGAPVVAKVLNGGEHGDLRKLHSRFSGRSRIRAARRSVDRFIVISDEIDKELEHNGVPASKRVYIPNGVDVRRFGATTVTLGRQTLLAKRFELPAGGPTVVFCGRLTAQKRVFDVLRVWPRVRQRFADARLLIAGTGDLERELRRDATQGVHFLGMVEDVPALLSLADLVVSPSASEGLSNTMLEAMASSRCVVSTRVGGAPDLISHGGTGWLYSAGDQEALCFAICHLLDDATARTEMGHAARARVTQSYSIQSTSRALKALYETVASTRLNVIGRPSSGGL